MKIPKAIYSEEGWALGDVESSPCGSMIVLHLRTEPYRTMVLNAITDYALLTPYEEDGYRMQVVNDVDNPHFDVMAKSALQANLWTKIGEVKWEEIPEEKAIFRLSRIRVKYNKE